MHIHLSRRLIITLAMFVLSFILIMILFIKRPDIVKSRNRIVRAVMVFSIAFVPGVMAASICAALITGLWNNAAVPEETAVIEQEDEAEEEESSGEAA